MFDAVAEAGAVVVPIPAERAVDPPERSAQVVHDLERPKNRRVGIEKAGRYADESPGQVVSRGASPVTRGRRGTMLTDEALAVQHRGEWVAGPVRGVGGDLDAP